MADLLTPQAKFIMPEVGGSLDNWGEKLNENWQKVDGLITRGPNLLINGGMDVAQRAATASGLTGANGYFTLDRWRFGPSTHTWSMYQYAGGPVGTEWRLRLICTAGGAVQASTAVQLYQAIEAQNCQAIGFGRVGAKPITLSFWVNCTGVTGTFVVELYQLQSGRTVSATYTVNSTSTWEYKTITFPADPAGGIIVPDNTIGLRVNFYLAAGSNYTSSPLQTVWGPISTPARAAGQNNALLAGGANFYLANVQLEAGAIATPFAYRSIAEELALCQRYYIASDMTFMARGKSGYGTNAVLFPVTMRAAPAFSGTLVTADATNALVTPTKTGMHITAEFGATTSARYGYTDWTADAEL